MMMMMMMMILFFCFCADAPISGGQMKIEVKYFFFSVYSETENLCSDTSCPIPAGDFVVSHTQELPGITPPVSLFSFCSNSTFMPQCFDLAQVAY